MTPNFSDCSKNLKKIYRVENSRANVLKMEDKKENLSLLQQNRVLRSPSWYFRRRKQQRTGNFKRAWLLNGVRNYVWRWFSSETVRTMYRKVKNIKEFRSLLLASLSSQELWIARSCVKRVLWHATGWRITFVESALYGEAKTSEPLKWSTLSFPWGRSTSQQNPPQYV